MAEIEQEWHARQERARQLALGIDYSQAREVAAAKGRNQILGPAQRKAIARAASHLNPINGRTAQARWDKLLTLGTDKPGSLGFVAVGTKGTVSLGATLGTSSGHVSEMLKRLQNEGLVITYRQHPAVRRPRLVALQVPLVTDWLVWLAQRRHWDITTSGPTNAMRSADALNLACDCLARRSAPPQHLVTQTDAENYIRKLRRRPPN